MFCTKACPAITTLALRSCLSPRIGRSLDLRRPWSASLRLLAYRSVRCQAPGSSSSSMAGYAAVLSVTTSAGVHLVVPMVCSKKQRAALASRRVAANTSTTWPNWSIARYAYRHLSATFTYVWPTCHRAPTAWRHATRPSGVGQQRREPQHPPVHDRRGRPRPPLGEQHFDVAVGQAEAQGPADREHDHIGRKAEAGKGGPKNWSGAGTTGSHAYSLAGPGSHSELNSACRGRNANPDGGHEPHAHPRDNVRHPHAARSPDKPNRSSRQ